MAAPGDEDLEEELAVVNIPMLNGKVDLRVVAGIKVQETGQQLRCQLGKFGFQGERTEPLGCVALFEKDAKREMCHFLGTSVNLYELDTVLASVPPSDAGPLIQAVRATLPSESLPIAPLRKRPWTASAEMDTRFQIDLPPSQMLTSPSTRPLQKRRSSNEDQDSNKSRGAASKKVQTPAKKSSQNAKAAKTNRERFPSSAAI
eukprot:CAMPEP_0184520856 /NCGR_PEP_ID=MMETSP0198_2-20121128/7399_1 /TAXON_ID=1112570 /ORGANISM="Thraustochytrium sp., Strain LLF1b" /LENGTH=202 /DNA_ID=CAMNT_0026911499 /DNA_START=289 /DNA_END=897 /DNA_ORIENTATION=-